MKKYLARVGVVFFGIILGWTFFATIGNSSKNSQQDDLLQREVQIGANTQALAICTLKGLLDAQVQQAGLLALATIPTITSYQNGKLVGAPQDIQHGLDAYKRGNEEIFKKTVHDLMNRDPADFEKCAF